MRSYDDPCGIARGLNVIGERWSLLIVRELLFGPKRFTDLHHGLPTASQNVLSQRLRELEQTGVVRRRRLSPPAATWVYELTEWGRDLEPALFHLARWGSRGALTSGDELSADALMFALKTSFDPEVADEMRGTYQIRLGDDRFRAQIADGRLDLTRGTAERPDAVLDTDPATLRSLVFGDLNIGEALDKGTLRVEGDGRAAARFVTVFPRPVPVA
ncbi:MAG: transcriptional regulator, HxlR family [Actinoallomurus sp.]|jgi:DNA-binding HxlR family transcriptional regulator|nr:transcriptional regulator, HxlR family [Actinoallomurus sp.]